MKQLFTAVALLISAASVRADTFGNLITGTLLDRVSVVSQFRSGETKLALLDSIILVGSYRGSSLLHLQAGFAGETKPAPGEVSSANLLAGAQLRLDPFFREAANFPDAWKFLNSIEHGPSYHYDFRTKDWYASYTAGLAFGLNPQQ